MCKCTLTLLKRRKRNEKRETKSIFSWRKDLLFAWMIYVYHNKVISRTRLAIEETHTKGSCLFCSSLRLILLLLLQFFYLFISFFALLQRVHCIDHIIMYIAISIHRASFYFVHFLFEENAFCRNRKKKEGKPSKYSNENQKICVK